MSVECGDKHPTEEVRCQIDVDSPHVSHWYKTPWAEHEWPNEGFVRPPVPSGPVGRLNARMAMVEMSRRLEAQGLRDGETFEKDRDFERLNAQHLRVMGVMLDGGWHSLSEISGTTGDPEASVSARIRDFRKERFGKHEIEKRHVESGMWEYRLVSPSFLRDFS